ncbi:pectate lyase family protein [Carboxylicivirga linearis]|uniref:Pectate lyase n=1 Tax=Carboxylicivirga linearis TaxID=1628157 RepID=A0ABS5JVB7_9BACT|nr:pectate lyase [Carboxylicivirga linearis]MBS2098424.1 pectate lyase [Carboxylicivirga linearis]
MKNNLLFLLICFLPFYSCSDKSNDTEEPSTIEITFDNPNPLSVDIATYKPIVSGQVTSDNILTNIKAYRVNGSTETVIEEISIADGSFVYDFSFAVSYQTATTGVRIEAIDELGQQKSETLSVTVERSTAVDPEPIGDVDAFPGAEGYGRYTTGGRGGRIFFVDNLLDDSQPGCLRYALSQTGARTIIFRVSGTIELNSPLVISQNHLTIAGQSAPGDGICIAGNYMQIKDGLENVIIRYVRFRAAKGYGEYDAAWGRNCKNIIFDHCTFSWGNDEVASFYDNTNFTMQWCLISESFYRSTHPKGDHSYGGIWGGMGATFHHNLLVHHTSRNPRFCGARFHWSTRETELVDFRNNVLYNWGDNSAYGGEGGKINMVNNYYKPGPATASNKTHRIVEIYGGRNDSDYPEDGQWFIDGNYVFNNSEVTSNNYLGIDIKNTIGSKDDQLVSTPFEIGEIQTETAEDAYESVLADVGSSIKRDVVDTRIIQEVKEGTALFGGAYGAGTGIIDSENDTEGYPILEQYNEIKDFDNDGMDDDWELANGLDPTDSSDHKEKILDSNFTNLEVYLNYLLDQGIN